MRTFATRSSPSQRDVSPEPARLRAAGIQARLKINAPGDVYEQEADRVADRVLRLPEPGVQRSCSCGGDCPDCRKKQEEDLVLQRRAEGAGPAGEAAPASVQTALRSPGQALDSSTERFFSSRFGHDFRNVRVHTDSPAARSAQEIQASAYTVGRDIVFAPGLYAPGSHEGRRLLAHELTHVVQQSAHAGLRNAVLQRKTPVDAEDVAKLDVSKSKNGAACACLVVVHNDERKARKTADLMHQNCSYNLALVNPDDGNRHIELPSGDIDPNELYPKDVAKECATDEAACKKAMEGKAKSKKRGDVEAYLQRRYFLGIKDCSESFKLPVVALHNNRIEDTEGYREKLKAGKVKTSGLKTDIDKKATGGTTVEELKKRLKEIGTRKVKVKGAKEAVEKDVEIVDELAGRRGTTNIFRWCVSDDLSRCHIGDPEHPDHVIWVTNEEDFKKLSKKDVNVALQSDVPASAKSVSATDLSTLFLFLREIFDVQLDELIAKIEQDLLASVGEIADIIKKIEKLSEHNDLRLEDVTSGLWKILLELLEILLQIFVLLSAQGARASGLPKLRYLNIETPGLAESDNPVSDYEFVRGALEEVGLHCCGKDTAAQDKIKEELKKLEKK